MRVFTIPGAEFTNVTYLTDDRLFAAHYLRGRDGLKVWNLGPDDGHLQVIGLVEDAAWRLFRPGAAAAWRRLGLRIGGEVLPIPAGFGQPGVYMNDAGLGQRGVAAAFAPTGGAALDYQVVVAGGRYSTRFHLRDVTETTPFFHAASCFGPCGTFSPDGRLVAMSGGDPAVSVWDVADRREVARLDQTDKVLGLAFVAPDRLAVAAGRTVRLWTLDGRPAVKLGTYRKYARALAVSPDLRLVAVGGRDGLVRVWEVEGGNRLAEYDWGIGSVNALAFAPSGQTAAAAGRTGLVVWDVD